MKPRFERLDKNDNTVPRSTKQNVLNSVFQSNQKLNSNRIQGVKPSPYFNTGESSSKKLQHIPKENKANNNKDIEHAQPEVALMEENKKENEEIKPEEEQ